MKKVSGIGRLQGLARQVVRYIRRVSAELAAVDY